MRVPLMGVKKELQNSRLASQMAFMLIEYIRRDAKLHFGTKRAEIGWILEDNQGMVAIAEAIEATVNREYLIYEKPLSGNGFLRSHGLRDRERSCRYPCPTGRYGRHF